jgi:hypothetical protein
MNAVVLTIGSSMASRVRRSSQRACELEQLAVVCDRPSHGIDETALGEAAGHEQSRVKRPGPRRTVANDDGPVDPE